MKKQLPKALMIGTLVLFTVFYILSFFGNDALSLREQTEIIYIDEGELSQDSDSDVSFFDDINGVVGSYSSDQVDKVQNTINQALSLDNSTKPQENDSYKHEPVAVYCLDVGQGSSIIVRVGTDYLLYDGGDWDTADNLIESINSLGIDSFRYVFVSHYDSDHVAGIIKVIENYDIDTLVAPDYVATTDTFNIFQDVVEESGLVITYPYPEQKFWIGDAEIVCIAPCDDSYMDENDYSVGIRLSYQNFSMLVCGDATKVSEQEILSNGQSIKSSVYIVNHHGSSSSTSQEFLDAVNPQICVISCGNGNEYGHPTKEVLDRIKQTGAILLRTDQHGNIVITTDGISFQAYTDKDYNQDTLWNAGVQQEVKDE